MTIGFRDGKKKFHPITAYQKVRKSKKSIAPKIGVRLQRAMTLHSNARKVSELMGNNKDFGIEGSRFLTLDGKFSVEEGTHEEIVDRYRKLVGMKKDPKVSDSGNEFQERTGVIRTQIDLTGKSLGKPTINLEARTEPTVAQLKTLRDIIKNSDVPKDNIILSDSNINWKRFENGIGFRLKRAKGKCVGDACKRQSEEQFDKNLDKILKNFDKTRKAGDEEKFEKELESILNRKVDKKFSQAESNLNKGAGILESSVDQAVASVI